MKSWMKIFAAAVLAAVIPAQLFAASKPKVALVFEEKVQGVFGLSGGWVTPGRGEEIAVAALKDAGYEIVDSQTIRANLLREQAVQVLAGDQKAAVAAGTRLGAPFVIVGKGYAKTAGNIAGSSMKSMQATVQFQLINAGSGEVIASTTANAAKPHVDEVIGGGEALAAASTDAMKKLLAAWAKEGATASGGTAAAPASSGGRLKVSISGLKSYRHFVFVQEWIEKNTAGFKSFENAKYTTGSADLEIACTAKGHELAKAIAKEKFTGFSVNPIEVGDDSVILKAIVNE